MKKIALISLILFSCIKEQKENSVNCEIDFEFKSRFQNCIDLLSIRMNGVYVDSYDAWDAYYCLKSLTKHESYMDVQSDTPLSYELSDTVNYFCKDVEKWLLWYKENKCLMNMQKANAILNKDSVSWPKYLDEYNLNDLRCTIHLVSTDSLATE